MRTPDQPLRRSESIPTRTGGPAWIPPTNTHSPQDSARRPRRGLALACPSHQRTRATTSCRRQPCLSPPARLSTPSTGRSSASISLEYRVLTNAGLATSHVVARSGDPQISSAGPRPCRGSDQHCADLGDVAGSDDAERDRATAEARLPRIAGTAFQPVGRSGRHGPRSNHAGASRDHLALVREQRQ